MALEQRQVERRLVVEVAVQDRLGDTGGGGDVVEPRPVVAVLAEQPPGGLDDQVPALLGGQTLPLLTS